MERPAKRQKLSGQDSYPAREIDPRMREDGPLHHVSGSAPTKTAPPLDLRRRDLPTVPAAGAVLAQNRKSTTHQTRRADATVTASVIDVQVDEGSATLATTEVTAAANGTVVPISDLGSVTVPALTSTASGTSLTQNNSSLSSNSSASTSSQSLLSSILSSVLTDNSTITSAKSTITVTATSTFHITYNNGTFIPPQPPTDSRSHYSSNSIFPESSQSSSTLSTSSSLTGDISSSSTLVPGGSPAPSTGTGPTSSTPPTSSSTNTHSTGPALTPQQQTVVGGVVGGVAGLALVLLALLVFLRWYRSRLKSQGRLPEQLAHRNQSRRHIRGASSNGGSGYEMTQSKRGSNAQLAAALASSLRKWRPHSAGTFATSSSTGPGEATSGERGFQKISGRKIAPVLGTGGDGYGGDWGVFEKELHGRQASTTNQQILERSLSRNSFYRDSKGFYSNSGFDPVRSSSAPGLASQRFTANMMSTKDFAEYFPIPPANTPATSMAGPGSSPLRSHSEINVGLAGEAANSSVPGRELKASRPEGFAVMRPGPARTPTTSSLPDHAQICVSSPRGLRGTAGLAMDPEAPPTPPLPEFTSGEAERGRLTVPSRDRMRGDVSVGSSRSLGSRSTASRFQEGL